MKLENSFLGNTKSQARTPETLTQTHTHTHTHAHVRTHTHTHTHTHHTVPYALQSVFVGSYWLKCSPGASPSEMRWWDKDCKTWVGHSRRPSGFKLYMHSCDVLDMVRGYASFTAQWQYVVDQWAMSRFGKPWATQLFLYDLQPADNISL